jgi:hypothetical protein
MDARPRPPGRIDESRWRLERKQRPPPAPPREPPGPPPAWGDDPPPPNERQPPWWVEPVDSPGSIRRADYFESDRERRTADCLRAGGNNVLGVEKRKSKTTADARVRRTVDDPWVSVDFKHPQARVAALATRIQRRVRSSINRADPQARNVVVDLRGIPVTDTVAYDAAREIRKLVGGWEGRLDFVRIVGDTFDLTFGPFS